MDPHHHHHHQTTAQTNYTDNKPTVRFYTKANIDFSLTIRDGTVVLASTNPSDLHQHWIIDEKFSTMVKDEEGFPSFALVNKATGQALKHPTGATKPVQLTEFNPDWIDESVLWTRSGNLGDGFYAVRMVNNIKLNLDASKGEVGIHDGSEILVWEWTKGDNQRWTVAPFCKFLNPPPAMRYVVVRSSMTRSLACFYVSGFAYTLSGVMAMQIFVAAFNGHITMFSEVAEFSAKPAPLATASGEGVVGEAFGELGERDGEGDGEATPPSLSHLFIGWNYRLNPHHFLVGLTLN
ncbi:hypothetical protein LXL04_004732 [Taraxacum kok-saghyz]